MKPTCGAPTPSYVSRFQLLLAQGPRCVDLSYEWKHFLYVANQLLYRLCQFFAGWGDHLRTKLFSSSRFRSPSLIEAYVNPEKGWLVFFGILAVFGFNFSAIFCHDRCRVAEWAPGPGKYGILPLASSIPQRWKDAGQLDCCDFRLR